MNYAAPSADLTDKTKFAAGGLRIGRACGIGAGEHKTIQTAGGRTDRMGIWRCAACVTKREEAKKAREVAA